MAAKNQIFASTKKSRDQNLKDKKTLSQRNFFNEIWLKLGLQLHCWSKILKILLRGDLRGKSIFPHLPNAN